MAEKNQNEIIKKQASIAERFTNTIMREFQSVFGDVETFDGNKKRLAQHLFIKIDSVLKELEIKRQKDSRKENNPPMTWEKLNLQKLAFDAMNVIEVGLDALIDNHIYPIPYLNGKTGQYDLDLRVGYIGKDYYRRRFAVDVPEQIIYNLVYKNDEFKVYPKDKENEVENYSFHVKQPFERGEIVGGFGYIMRKDKTKNKLVIVTMPEIERAKSKALTNDFWGSFEDRMQYKTLVNIVTHARNLPIDPAKINECFYRVEEKENEVDKPLITEIIEDPKKNIENEKNDQETEEIEVENETKSSIKKPDF